jgi:hypothetical protein
VASQSAPTVVRNTISGCGGTGMLCEDTGAGFYVEDNKIFQNGDCGVRITGKGACTFRRNHLYQNAQAGIMVEDTQSSLVEKNDLWDHDDMGMEIACTTGIPPPPPAHLPHMYGGDSDSPGEPRATTGIPPPPTPAGTAQCSPPAWRSEWLRGGGMSCGPPRCRADVLVLPQGSAAGRTRSTMGGGWRSFSAAWGTSRALSTTISTRTSGCSHAHRLKIEHTGRTIVPTRWSNPHPHWEAAASHPCPQ